MTALLLAAAIGAGVTCERYPDADSVVVDDVQTIEYRPDGTYCDTEEQWVKILTDKGLRDESIQRIDFSLRYGTASVVRVSAIAPDGIERTIDVSKTTKETTDNSSMGSNIYDPLDRMITCSIPGLKVGDVLRVKTVRKTHFARMENAWADISVLEWTSPFVRASVHVKAPKELPLKRIAIRHPLGNVMTNLTVAADGSILYSWMATNSPQAFPEPDMPPLYTQIQNLRVSTIGEWRDVSRWYWNLCAPHIAKTNAAMVAKARELKTVRDIFRFVSQEVRYMGLTMEDKSPGYAPHDVDITFENRYGVCRDKAALLTALLRAAGHKAFPVLIHVGAKMDPEVPSPFFNHAIVAIDTGRSGARKYELMDPTDETARDLMPAYLSNRSFLVARPEGEDLGTSPTVEAKANALVIDSRGELSADGSIVLEQKLDYTGINDTVFRHALVRRTPEERKRLFEKLLKNRFAGTTLLRCEVRPADLRDTDTPLSVKLAMKVPDVVLKGTTRNELAVPLLSPSFGLVNWLLDGKTSLEKRRFSIDLDSTASIEETLRIRLAGQLGECVSLPQPEKFDGKYSYEREFYVDSTDDSIAVRRSLAVNSLEFSPEEYLELRERVKEVETAERRKCVFERNRFADADRHILWDTHDIGVSAANSFVATNHTVMQILTYDGKKRSSDLRYEYSPAFEKIEVISAVISNLDGKVSTVTAKEMNVMDAGWASSAPRYSASKILVVNLPGVEIGSVIDLVTVHTVKDAPVDFCKTWSGVRSDPTDYYAMTINGVTDEYFLPEREKREPMRARDYLARDWHGISSNDFRRAAARLRVATKVKGLKHKEAGGDIESIRKWVAKYIRTAGPGLYAAPLEGQLTDPKTVIAERYGSRLDRIRTLTALLKGAGYDAEIVFAANDSGEDPRYRRMIMEECPMVAEFAYALCRVRIGEGGFLGFGATEKTIFIGVENEYAELGATGFAGADYFDPQEEAFGVVTVPSEELADLEIDRTVYALRENGAADIDVENIIGGSGVAGFRKLWTEILPEERSRKYQAYLGAIAQAASATKELETDVVGYPATLSFSCFVPGYATIEGDMMTLTLDEFKDRIFTLTGEPREGPIHIPEADNEITALTVIFPEGYTEIEHIPAEYEFADPTDPSQLWYSFTFSPEMKKGRLEVKILRRRFRRGGKVIGRDYAALLDDWARTASSKSNRTISVRKAAE